MTAGKLVVATNAYTRSLKGLPRLRSRQIPMWTFQVVTAPLTAAQWESIGWKNQQSFEDNRQLVHYFRPTVDGRITMGGGDITARRPATAWTTTTSRASGRTAKSISSGSSRNCATCQSITAGADPFR